MESLGQRAMDLGLDPLAFRLTRPLRVEPDLRPRPWIVVLSGGITSKGLLNATTQARVEWAAQLYRDGLAQHLVVSGGPRRPGRPPSGPAMKALAVDFGVPEDQIEIEGHSSRTAENAEEVASLVRKRGEPSILLVTSAIHMRRAKLCFQKQGVDVGAAPVPRIEGEPPERASVVSQALHEYIGLLYYGLRRWI
ncbi:MAG: YdcF family protein [Candidatus Binatia bacterium]|nr:YdcF family protein [Candidatus Binatia bacterium]